MNRNYEFSEIASTFVPRERGRERRPLTVRHRQLRRNFETLFDTKKRYVEVDRTTEKSNRTFTFIDLFAGAGGLSVGFQNAGFRKLFSVEIDADASATLKRNFPRSTHFQGPIEGLSDHQIAKIAEKWPDVDIVCGGPPCQGFSVAGARDPKDPRNVLFKQFVRFVNLTRPKFVVLENVPGILTMQKGAVQEAIRSAFADIGYPEMSVALLEAAEYGVPQIRPRAIFIANRVGAHNPYPSPKLTEESFIPIEAAIMDLADVRPNPAINHEWTRHSAKVEERIARVAPGGSLYPSYIDAFKRQYAGKPSMTVKENHGGTHIHPHRNRVLSAREMARLQTFPDSFIFEGTMKRAMWQIGNAVPPLLGEYIALAIRSVLDEVVQIQPI